MTRAIRHALAWLIEVLVLRPLTCIVIAAVVVDCWVRRKR